MKSFIILLLAASAAPVTASTLPVIIPPPYPALYVAEMVKTGINHEAKRCNKANKCHKGKYEENR